MTIKKTILQTLILSILTLMTNSVVVAENTDGETTPQEAFIFRNCGDDCGGD